MCMRFELGSKVMCILEIRVCSLKFHMIALTIIINIYILIEFQILPLIKNFLIEEQLSN